MGELGQQAVGLVDVTKLHRKHSSSNFAGSLAKGCESSYTITYTSALLLVFRTTRIQQDNK